MNLKSPAIQLLLGVILLAGCIGTFETLSFTPTPATPSSRPAPADKKIVCVYAPFYCAPCEKQKGIIRDMKRAGDLNGVHLDEIAGNTNPTYPAAAYPTLYVCSSSGSCQRFQGAQTRETILRALR